MSYREIIKKLQAVSTYRGHLHGPAHWLRVERFGRELAILSQLNELESRCVEVFALTHDLGRLDDGSDKQHPVSGSELFINNSSGFFPDLSHEQIDIIHLAILHHSDGLTAGEAYESGLLSSIDYEEKALITIMGCCWDADRLDLLRLCMDINSNYMSTLYWGDVLPLARSLNNF